MRFTLNIDLDNEAMRDRTDVARALRALVAKLEQFPTLDEGTLRDTNGNTVGRWEMTA